MFRACAWQRRRQRARKHERRCSHGSCPTRPASERRPSSAASQRGGARQDHDVGVRGRRRSRSCSGTAAITAFAIVGVATRDRHRARPRCATGQTSGSSRSSSADACGAGDEEARAGVLARRHRVHRRRIRRAHARVLAALPRVRGGRRRRRGLNALTERAYTCRAWTGPVPFATCRRSTSCSATNESAAEPRALAVAAARSALEHARAEIKAGRDAGSLVDAVLEEIERARRPALRRVLNATGVLVHTNLGRAPLSAPRSSGSPRSAPATRTWSTTSRTASAGRGRTISRRSSRRLTGAEAALVVNNNAAAVLLALAALAEGREVVVSRGELIEIGDGFRIPDVLARSGAKLVEVGTTNRTRAADYERAIGPDTALILRVHQSNFRVVGFSELPRLVELAEIAGRHELPLVDDLGSGRARAGRRRADACREPAGWRRPRHVLRRQAARRPAGRDRRRASRARRAPPAASAPARAPGGQAHARRARGHARCGARSGPRGDSRAADAPRAGRARSASAPSAWPEPWAARSRRQSRASGAARCRSPRSRARRARSRRSSRYRSGSGSRRSIGIVRDGRLLLDCRTLTDAELDEVATAVLAARQADDA